MTIWPLVLSIYSRRSNFSPLSARFTGKAPCCSISSPFARIPFGPLRPASARYVGWKNCLIALIWAHLQPLRGGRMPSRRSALSWTRCWVLALGRSPDDRYSAGKYRDEGRKAARAGAFGAALGSPGGAWGQDRARRRRDVGHRHPGDAVFRRVAHRPRQARRSRARPLYLEQGPLCGRALYHARSCRFFSTRRTPYVRTAPFAPERAPRPQ